MAEEKTVQCKMCPFCYGTGAKLPSGDGVCEVCGGTGQVPIDDKKKP